MLKNKAFTCITLILSLSLSSNGLANEASLQRLCETKLTTSFLEWYHHYQDFDFSTDAQKTFHQKKAESILELLLFLDILPIENCTETTQEKVATLTETGSSLIDVWKKMDALDKNSSHTVENTKEKNELAEKRTQLSPLWQRSTKSFFDATRRSYHYFKRQTLTKTND